MDEETTDVYYDSLHGNMKRMIIQQLVFLQLTLVPPLYVKWNAVVEGVDMQELETRKIRVKTTLPFHTLEVLFIPCRTSWHPQFTSHASHHDVDSKQHEYNADPQIRPNRASLKAWPCPAPSSTPAQPW